MTRKTIVSPDEMPDAPPECRVVNAKYWWNQGLPHPMSDEVFTGAALEHYLLTSTDHHVKKTRNSAFHLLKILHGIEIETALKVYREEHGE